jgi:anti-sigma regulatory factor (Ser/Thr protein kinase)
MNDPSPVETPSEPPHTGPSGASQEHLELELETGVGAPARARAAMHDRCEAFALSTPSRQTLLLLVSELVSNAVLHADAGRAAPILLTAQLGGDPLCVSVTDAGSGFTPEPPVPAPRSGGYGLYLLDRAASRWGVDRTRGTRVWFELPRSAAPLPRGAGAMPRRGV